MYLRPYLNLLVKPRIVFRFSGKNIILCILKGEMPFKIHKIIFFSRKKKCAPSLPKIFRLMTWNTYFFTWPKLNYFVCCSNSPVTCGCVHVRNAWFRCLLSLSCSPRWCHDWYWCGHYWWLWKFKIQYKFTITWISWNWYSFYFHKNLVSLNTYSRAPDKRA